MSMSRELRFRCDRCHAVATRPVQNTPVPDRLDPPEGWMVLLVDNSASHLCADCAPGLTGFLANRKEQDNG